MMTIRSVLFATALLAATTATASAQVRDQVRDQIRDDVIVAPVLRANVTVAGNVVRIGDVIDNAGPAAKIAIYRAPDLGTTGSLPTAQLIATLRAHQVIGVDTGDISEVSITRLARTFQARDLEFEVARALEHKNGLGDAANLAMTFDRDVQTLRLDPSYTGALQPTSLRFEPRNNRFDVTFEIANENASTPTRLRFTGSVIETVETAVPTRNLERGEVLKPSDVAIERRPKAEAGTDLATRDRTVGMQARKQLRAGQPIKLADFGKPDLVQRDQNVTLTYEAAGLFLTVRGKAVETGAEGDVVNVVNLQSKRTVAGVVIGRGQISVTGPRATVADAASSLGPDETAATGSIVLNNTSSAAPKAE
jgi:flagella basal body P-ring formation protein FlgA